MPRCVSGEILHRSQELGLIGSRPVVLAGQAESAGACPAGAATLGCTPVTNVASSHSCFNPHGAWAGADFSVRTGKRLYQPLDNCRLPSLKAGVAIWGDLQSAT